MAEQALADRLEALRERMRAHDLHFYLVPSSDAHRNEYVPDCWQRRAFVSGFSGSAGEALIGREGAWLWTDSRYWLQAERQLDGARWELMRSGRRDVPSLEDWLEQAAKGATVGVDPRVITQYRARQLEKKLLAGEGTLRSIDENQVDASHADLPPLPRGEAHVLDDSFTGASVGQKLLRIRERMEERDCDWLVLTTLDAIAWSFNVRGRDVDYNPLLISYALLGRDDAVLFVDAAKIGADVAAHLERAGVRSEPYAAVGDALPALTGRVWIDPREASWWVGMLLEQSQAEVVEETGPIALMKARKNDTEIAGMRAAHVRDGAALVRFLHWIEGAWGEGLDELGAAEQLERFRGEGERFQGLSFPTISGFAGNGAIVHYGVTRESAARIHDGALYLVDSGAQYLDGTTDVTRTVHLGTPTAEECRHYTRVLKGHLALRAARFPLGTTGVQLDVLARSALWQAGLDYGHGTGHGVGHYLNVHEGPQSISSRGTVALEPGMIVSNEPGLYLPDRYGIRIENLLLVVQVQSADETGSVPFYGFEDLTWVPYCRVLIDTGLLDRFEIAAIDAYHQEVCEVLQGTLPAGASDWLSRETAPLA